jgi:glycosyltransferase involved in cell wall biosynthesis
VSAPTVSCLIPARNAERYLAEAIASALAQTHPVHEIVVVDDGSTDATATVASAYGPPVRVIRQPPLSIAAGRNAGLRAARGEFIAFLDADDVWYPEKLERQLARFRERPGTDLSTTRFQNFWDPELRDEAERYAGHPLAEPMSGYLPSVLVARRALFERVGGLDERIRQGADSCWFAHALERGAVLDELAEVLVRRRLHRTNDSRRPGPERFAQFLRFAKARLDARRRQETSARHAD